MVLDSIQKLILFQVPLMEIMNGHHKSTLEIPGVYAFWWIGSVDLLKDLNRKVYFQGKKLTQNEKIERTEWQDEQYMPHSFEWKVSEENFPICLYIGKTSNIHKRVRQHIMIGTKSSDWYRVKLDRTPFIKDLKINKINTTCQLRAGLEHLYNNPEFKTHHLEDKLKNIGFSHIKIEDFEKRYYLECLAIGYFKPWFNLDSER